jgi:hypothetical protein
MRKRPKRPPLRKRVWWPWVDSAVKKTIGPAISILVELIRKHLGL